MRIYLLFTLLMSYYQNAIAQTDTAKVSKLSEIETLKRPQFPGGDNALMDFLKKTIRYPAHEKRFKVEGRVLLKFNFLSDGTIDSIIIEKGASTGLNEEAIRAVKLMPKYIIDTTNESYKRFFYRQPITYSLGDEADVDPAIILYNFNLSEKFVPRDTIIKFVAENKEFEDAFLSFTRAEYDYAARHFIKSTVKTDNAAAYVLAALSYNGDKNKLEVCNNLSKAFALNYTVPDKMRKNIEVLNSQCIK